MSHVEVDPTKDDPSVASVQKQSACMVEMEQMMQEVVNRLEELEASEARKSGLAATQQPQAKSRRRIVCWRCHKRGHIVRNCTEKPSAQQGN